MSKILRCAFVKTNSFQRMLFILIVSAMIIIPMASAAEDSCREAGIYIGNQTGIDLWYKLDGGPCTIWNHGHILIIKPENTFIIYINMDCGTEYCPNPTGYNIYKSLDANQNCRVRILPDCNLSDM